MQRKKICVIVLWKENKPEYYVGTSFEGGHTSLHCGPYSTENEAWAWIDAVAETDII